MRLSILLTLFVSLSLPLAAAEPPASPASPAGPQLRWFKGNTHTHTKNSDGDSTPSVVARWYRNNRYDFLMLTDHNVRTEVEDLQREISAENILLEKKPFLLIPGEEVSDAYKAGERNHPLHINALDTTVVIGKQGGKDLVDTLQNCIDAIHRAGGLPHVNHPNFVWALTADDLYKLRNLRHFEIYNGHPQVNNLGGGGLPGTEEIWDSLLSRGRLFYGVAVDDAHNFKKFARNLSNPGRGWVMVRAAELTPGAVIEALSQGDFYASTGVELDEISTSGKTLRLKITPYRDQKYRTEFIGRGGKVLKMDESMEPIYQLTPDDLYVRARVTSSGGDQAWSQPLYGDDEERRR